MTDTSSEKISFRTGYDSDLEIVNSLVRESKAYWDYSNEFMDKFMSLFKLTTAYLEKNTVKLMLAGDVIVGIYSFNKQNSKSVELDYFFIHSDYLGKMLGKQLWAHACGTAKDFCISFIIWIDPNAERFYKKMGCIQIGERESPVLPGRMAAVMQYHLK